MLSESVESHDALLSWKEVEEDLAEAVKMYWRLPGQGGRWPFAKDAPWHLMTREARADGASFQVWAQEREAEAARDMRNVPATVPLTAEEVTWMEQRLGWLLHIGDRDRKLAELVLKQRAAGAVNVDWKRIKAKLPLEIGRKGLYRRYTKAIQAVTEAVNRGDLKRAA